MAKDVLTRPGLEFDALLFVGGISSNFFYAARCVDI